MYAFSAPCRIRQQSNCLYFSFLPTRPFFMSKMAVLWKVWFCCSIFVQLKWKQPVCLKDFLKSLYLWRKEETPADPVGVKYRVSLQIQGVKTDLIQLCKGSLGECGETHQKIWLGITLMTWKLSHLFIKGHSDHLYTE